MGNDFNVVNQNGTFWHFSTQEQFGTNYDNGPNLLHWTGNEKFLYFAFINSIGGPGPVRPNAEVLFRMDLSTGNVVIVLGSIPRTYEEWVIHPFFIISISPTSRRLAYVAYRSSQLKLHVLDLQSGTKETIPVEPEYNLIGEITWSETGEQLVYMLYHYTDNFGYDSCSYTYAIRWLDLRDDSTTTFIKNIAMDPCIDYSASSYQAVSVSPDQVILKRGEEMWEYDVKSQKLNLQVTVTPSP